MPPLHALLFLILCSLSVVSPIAQELSDEGVKEFSALSIANRYEINSGINSELREFYVSLPASYESGQDHYPVLYLLDADQNMEHAVASARMLAQWRGVPEIIIVGIPSTNRLRDYTPTQVVSYSDQSGGGEQFVAFIEQVLIPHIDANYRTHSFRILSGHSLSGLLAANELAQASDTFDAYIIIAPSLWWNDFEMLENAPQQFMQNDELTAAAYFGIGEHDGFGMKQELKRYVDAIAAADNELLRFDHKIYSGEGHMSAPMPVTYDGLLFVFSDIPYAEENWEHFSTAGFLAREQGLQEKYGATAVQTAETYVGLANYLLRQGDFEGAVAVFARNAEIYPGFAPYLAWLANAYVLNGEIENAIIEYEKAYELTISSINGQGNANVYLEQLKLLRQPLVLSETNLPGLVGCYTNGEQVYQFTTENGRFFGHHDEPRRFELFAKNAKQFFMRVPPENSFSFVEEGARNVLLINTFGEQLRLPRVEGRCD